MVSNNVTGLGALKSCQVGSEHSSDVPAGKSVKYCHCPSTVTNRGRARKGEIQREKEIFILFCNYYKMN